MLTGEGQGDTEAEDRDLSWSSGRSTLLMRMERADKKRRWLTGLDGVRNELKTSQKSEDVEGAGSLSS